RDVGAEGATSTRRLLFFATPDVPPGGPRPSPYSFVWQLPQLKPLFMAGSNSGMLRSFAISGLTVFDMNSLIFGVLSVHALNFAGSDGIFGKSGFGISNVPCIAVGPWQVRHFISPYLGST